MSRAKLTHWFRGTQFPERDRPGIYQRKHADGQVQYSYWDGRMWCTSAIDPDRAYDLRRCSSYMQLLPWRGLTASPTGPVS